MSLIEKNQNYIVEITGMTHEGQGVGRIGGLAVFVDSALEGETVELKIIKLKKTYAVGKMVNIIKPSPHRTTPFCGSYNRCGGCNLQHMDYNAQLDFKTRLVRDSLERIGGLKDVYIHEAIGMKNPYNYRNKAQYPVAFVDGRIITGFYQAHSHNVVYSKDCGIQDVLSNKVREAVGEFIEEKDISAYDELSGEGLVRHILTRVGFNTGEVMVVLVINGGSIPHADELVTSLTDKIPSVKSIYLNVNKENTNIILGRKNIKLFGEDAISDVIGGYRFLISPHSFFQVNPVQTEVLYSKALEYAALTGTETLFDLYCGTGTISLYMSAKARMVYGVEVVEEAVSDAQRNSVLNGVSNVEFIAGEVEKAVPLLYDKGIRADVVVLDPPRKGCDESLLSLLVEMQPERIVYVSCNPATLARDLKYLDGQGYKAQEAQPVDMFPWTGHVEAAILLQRMER